MPARASFKSVAAALTVREPAVLFCLASDTDWQQLTSEERKSYVGIVKEFAGGHHRVTHSKGEYARDDVNTKTAEPYFALLKRGVMGSFRHVRKKHLGRYCDEFSHRWNQHQESDVERTAKAIDLSDGCRPMYRDPIRR